MKQSRNWSNSIPIPGNCLDGASATSYINPCLQVQETRPGSEWIINTSSDGRTVTMERSKTQNIDLDIFSYSTQEKSSASINFVVIEEIIVQNVDICPPDLLVRFIKLINELMQTRAYKMIDRVLAQIDYEDTPSEIIVASLRSTFPVKSKLYRWKDSLILAHQELNKRNLDADKILNGL